MRGTLSLFAAAVFSLSWPAARADSTTNWRATTKLAEPTPAERRVASAKMRLMSADYRADLAELARVREELAPMRNDPRLGYLVNYWTGYASWRLAINGMSKNMPSQDLKANLTDAVADMETSAKLRPDFADAVAAAASMHGWLGRLAEDPNVATEHYRQCAQLLASALQLGPDNPRVLWVQGGFYLFKPAAWGGDPARAEKIYERQTHVASSVDAHSPLPDWGEPEAWMSLAYAHLNRPDPDLSAARNEARMALKLQPAWSYVRDVLLPQIEAASAHSADSSR